MKNAGESPHFRFWGSVAGGGLLFFDQT